MHCVFEIDAVNIDRYFFDVMNVTLRPSLIFIDSKSEYQKYKKEGKFKDKGQKIICTAWMSRRKIENILLENKIEFFWVDAHRIPDVKLILICKALDIKVIYIQHGLYTTRMKRSFSFYVSNLGKTCRYLYYNFQVLLYSKSLFLFLLLFLIHIFNHPRSRLSQFNIFPDLCFLFSSYWRLWHSKHYGFPDSIPFKLIGFPDLGKFQFSKKKLDKKTICYCHQTLVEDGRVEWSEYKKFFISLVNLSLKYDYKLVIKVHPRISGTILKFFQSWDVEIFINDVPDVDLVVGHYSSLLAFWGCFGRRVISVDIGGHSTDDVTKLWTEHYSCVSLINFNVNKTNKTQCKYIFGDSFCPICYKDVYSVFNPVS